MLASLNGVNFRPAETRDIVKALNIGDELFLERDPENEYDGNAIKVLDEDGVFLGFVEKDIAADIAHRLDAGETPSVAVAGFLSTIKPHLEITFPGDDRVETDTAGDPLDEEGNPVD